MMAEYQFNPAVPESFSVNYSGTVVSDPYYNESTERLICILRLDELAGASVRYDVKLYLRSSTMQLTGIEYGQRLDCYGHVWPQDSATNPYEYDGMNALRADGLDGMAAAKLEDVTIHPAGKSLGSFRIRIRHAIETRIRALFPNNPELVNAFVLGNRNDLDQETRDMFSKTGVSHLICISGLHISTLAMAMSKLLSLKLSRRVSAFGTLAAVLIYGFLIGFPASLVRATIMFAIYSFVPVVGKPSDPITRLSAALLGMLVIKPFNVLDGGFVLSFAASAGILLLSEPIESLFHVETLKNMKPHPARHIRLLQRLIRYFPLLLCTTLAAQLATLPAVIAYFGAQPLLSIPVNLLAIPLAMTAYPLVLIALVVSTVVFPLGQAIAAVSDGMFTLLTSTVELFAALPGWELCSPNYPVWLLVVHCVILLCASGLNRFSIKVRRFLPLALILLVGVSMLSAWIDTLGFTAIFLDAGQADAAVIKAEGHVFMYDTGDLYSPAASYISGSCLRLDAVFLSHPHYDHAAGLTKLIEKSPPGTIYVPKGWYEVDASDSVDAAIDAAVQADIPIIELEAGDVLHPSENVVIRVLESGKSSQSVNDFSMLIEVTYFDRSFLYTGDLTTEGEPDQLPDIDVLKVPHHESKSATSDRLLTQTSPEIAIISVGENNYGHPSDQTLDRLHAAGIDTYRTDQCGAIEIRVTRSGKMNVRTYLSDEENQK